MCFSFAESVCREFVTFFWLPSGLSQKKMYRLLYDDYIASAIQAKFLLPPMLLGNFHGFHRSLCAQLGLKRRKRNDPCERDCYFLSLASVLRFLDGRNIPSPENGMKPCCLPFGESLLGQPFMPGIYFILL